MARVKHGKLHITAGDDAIESDKEVAFLPCAPDSDYFEIKDVIIGVDFHWEQKQHLMYRGSLKLLLSGNAMEVINVVPVEDYLYSVISSEMSAEAPLALLKAHAIISRSWLLSQIQQERKPKPEGNAHTWTGTGDGEYIRWYDHQDHSDFHVCADDHCQRYQGIQMIRNENVIKAVDETRGAVLMYQNGICDARYSKACGGVSESFENCWEPERHPYLQSVVDRKGSGDGSKLNLKVEEKARAFILGHPEAFCNTSDKKILSSVLNTYDQETRAFYRWTVQYSQSDLSALLMDRSGIDFGRIKALRPLERGDSGRLVKLEIEGTKKRLVIGKELTIRRWLSKSHLYSSAFLVEALDLDKEGIPGRFIFHGAGWGHGVGLCQIGAAVMAEEGYSHAEILLHYYKGAEIKKQYS
jgi:SpoIID/LytB domain protein